ncbi:MAG: ComEC family competence protein [Paramuribaculum sp.]|nr:ComEC family competence protein [Paramuribaculum sp.]
MPRRSVLSAFPLLPLTIAYAAGTVMGLFLWDITIAISIMLLCIVLLIIRYNYSAALGLSFLISFFSASFYSTADHDELTDNELIFQGTVKQHKISDTSQLMTVEIYAVADDSDTLSAIRPFDISVTLADFTPEIRPHDIITIKAKLNHPEPCTDLPYETDYNTFLIDRHIYFSTIIDRNNILDIIPGYGVSATGYRIKTKISDTIYQSGLSSSTKEFLNALITGDTTDLSFSTRQSFQKAGLAHILALSGLHVGIITIILSLALWPLYAIGHQKIRSVIIMTVLWGYCIITGFSPSVTRAVIMASILITGTLLHRRVSALNSLCAAALIILMFDPRAVISIGFQMSFAAVAAILIFAIDLNPISRRNQITYNIVSLLAVSISAMLGTGLLSIIYFHSFPVYFLLANIAVTLLLPPFLFIGIIIIAVTYMGLQPPILFQLTDIISNAITSVTDFFSSLPGATIDNIYISVWTIIPYICFLITLKLWLIKKQKLWGYITLGTCLLSILIPCLTASSHLPSRAYIARTSYHTDLIIDRGTPLLEIITTAWQDTVQIKNRAEFRYSEYMGRQGIHQLKVTPVNSQKHDTVIDLGDKHLCIIYRNPQNDTISKHTDILLICRGVTHPLNDFINKYSPDSVILSYDLSPTRIDNYSRQLDSFNIPYHTMRSDGAWSAPLKSH